MELIPCFDHSPELKDKFKELLKGKGDLSESEQKEIGKQLAHDHHQALDTELGKFKKGIGLSHEPLQRKDNTQAIKEINDKYDNQISQLKPTQNAIPERGPTPVNVAETSGNSPEMGTRISEPGETPIPQGEGENQGKEPRISGIAQRVQEQLGLKPYEAGKGWSKEEAFAFGKAAIAQGADPYKVVADPHYANLDFHERLAIAQAHDNALTTEMYHAADNFGEDSPQYKQAQKAVTDFQDSFQHLKTQSSQAFTAQQGEIDIDTGSFTAVKQAFKTKNGKPPTEDQEQHLKEGAAKVKELTGKVADLEQKLSAALDKEHGEGKETAKPTREKLSTKLSDLAKRLRTSSEFDNFLKGAGGDVQKMGVDLPRLKEIAASILEDAAKAVKAGENAIDFIRDAVGKLKDDVDKDKLTDALTKIGEKEGLFDIKESTDKIQAQFVDKKGNDFTTKEASDLWQYGKEQYLKKGVGFRDMIVGVSEDTGLTFDQVSHALITSKTKPISDEMWKNRRQLAKNKQAVDRYLDKQGQNPAIRKFNAVTSIFREAAVFGHGGVFVGTHSGMTLMDLPRMKHTVNAFFDAYKLAYGSEANYEQMMEGLKASKNYNIAQRAGLQNDPDVINNDAEIISSKLGKVSETGQRGFNAIKILRQTLFDSHYNNLSDIEKADPNSAISIAKLVNNATGATNLSLPPWVREVTFAGGMEAARWGKLTRNPMEATNTALKALFNPKSATVGEKVFAKVWASRVGWELATFGSLLVANAALQNKKNGGNNNVNILDPTKSDWLKMKMGNTTFDFTSGMLSTLNFAKKMIYQPISDDKADIIDKEGKTAFQYGVGKLSPFYSKVGEALLKHDYNGNTVPWSDAKPLNKWNHKMAWGEYMSSYAPLPVAEGFHAFYEGAQQNGMPKNKLDDILNGLKYATISGTTGFRAYETNQAGGTQPQANPLPPKQYSK